MKLKTKNKHKLLLTAIFAIVFVFGLGVGKVEKANAGYCAAYESSSAWSRGQATIQKKDNKPDSSFSEESCKKLCKTSNDGQGSQLLHCTYNENLSDLAKSVASGELKKQADNENSGICNWVSSDFFKCVLLAILRFMGWIVSLAATLFAWIVKPQMVADIINQGPIYETWAKVRDILNVAFILALLFSAFCTVFQVEKFNYKKMLLTIILMALLVNFSFPISRVIIDFSNVLMSYILNFSAEAGDASFFTKIANDGKLADILNPTSLDKADYSYLFAAIVFTFILAITLLVIAILFVVRTIMLAILVIFSPIAFVGSIVPMFSSQASKWWDNLFRYSFFGPIMIFMIYVSLQLMTSMKKFDGQIQAIAGEKANDSIVAAFTYFAIPVVILWVGLGFAQSVSIEGAAAITGRAKKFAGWARKTFTGVGLASGTWGAYRTRRKEAGKDSWGNRVGGWIGSKQDQLRGALPGVPGTGRGKADAASRYQKDLANKVKQEYDRNGMENMSVNNLRDLATRGNKFERAAALQALAENSSLDMTNASDKNNYERMRNEFGTTAQVFHQINNKLRTYDPATAFSHIENTAEREARITEFQQSNKFKAEDLGTNSLKNEEFMRLGFRNGTISRDNIEKLRGKSFYHEDSIRNTLQKLGSQQEFNDLTRMEVTKNEAKEQVEHYEAQLQNPALSANIRKEFESQLNQALAARTKAEVGLKNAKNVQTNFYQQTGKFHASINHDDNAKIQIIKGMDKESGKRTNVQTIKENHQLFADNIRANKYKDLVLNMEDIESQRELNTEMQQQHHEGGTSNAQSIYRLAKNDSLLKNIYNRPQDQHQV